MLRLPIAAALIAIVGAFAGPDRADAITGYIGTGDINPTLGSPDGETPQSATAAGTGTGVVIAAAGLVDIFGPNPLGTDIYRWDHVLNIGFDSVTGYSGGFEIVDPVTNLVYLAGDLASAYVDSSNPDEYRFVMTFSPYASQVFDVSRMTSDVTGYFLPWHGTLRSGGGYDVTDFSAVLTTILTGGTVDMTAFVDYEFDYRAVPLPSSMGFLVLGFGALAGARRLRRRA